MSGKNKIIIAAGGTGGHVIPAISLANFLKKNYGVEIFTDDRGIQYLESNQTLKIKKILSSKVSNKNIFYFIVGIIKLFLSIISSLKSLIKLKPKLIIGMGGYSSFAVCLSGYLLRIPILVYENNLVIGRANKFLLPFSKKILVSTNSVQGINAKYKSKIIFTGFFLRNNIFDIHQKRSINSNNELSILIMGGSQSAKVFGDEIPEIIKKCYANDIKFNVYQQCLDYQKSNIKNIYKKLNINFELFTFTDELAKFYQKCDIAITRCGASSLAELINLNIPLIGIPLPSSMDNHQFKNVKYFHEQGYCFFLEQKYLSEKLFDMLKNAHQDRNKLYLLKENMSKHSDKDSFFRAKKVIEEIMNAKN